MASARRRALAGRRGLATARFRPQRAGTSGHTPRRASLDTIDAELGTGGVVYVHCWAGCGRTGVVVGCWLVRHGAEPKEALERIARIRGLGCPQTLEQRLAVLGWQAGR